MSNQTGFNNDKVAGVEDLEGFFEVEAVFEELEDEAAEVPKDLELEGPDAFAALAWVFLHLCAPKSVICILELVHKVGCN